MRHTSGGSDGDSGSGAALPPASLRLFRYVSVLLVPAGLCLLWQMLGAATVADRLLLIGLILFCPELAYMAQVDLKAVEQVQQRFEEAGAEGTGDEDTDAEGTDAEDVEDRGSVDRFYSVVVSTIVLEVVGYYTALFSLALGGALIIFSQLWFNLLAGVQLLPEKTPAVVAYGIADRSAVLIANSLAFVLLLCWSVSSLRPWLSACLLFLITLFLLLKYGPVILSTSSSK